MHVYLYLCVCEAQTLIRLGSVKHSELGTQSVLGVNECG